jgi:phosphoribosylglycinamide formyltransferase-1
LVERQTAAANFIPIENIAMIRLAVFASGNGSNLQALLDACDKKSIAAEIVVVVSNNSNAFALNRANKAGIDTYHISQKKYPEPQQYLSKIESSLADHQVGLIVLAGYMKLLPSVIVDKYYGRIINIHPALLPKFGGAGMYGIKVHQAVIASGEHLSGATVHVVDTKFDHGPILIQRRVPVLSNDIPESLAARVLEIEHQILPQAVALYIK